MSNFSYVGTSEDLARVLEGGDETLYSWGPGGLLTQKRPAFRRRVITDIHGDVVALGVHNTGVPVGLIAYDAWGERRFNGGDAGHLGFQSDLTDPDTGSVDMLTRLYAPALGRFTTRDVLFGDPTRPQSLNQFTYGWDNPVSMTDPTGMCPAGHGCPPPFWLPKKARAKWLKDETARAARYARDWGNGAGYMHFWVVRKVNALKAQAVTRAEAEAANHIAEHYSWRTFTHETLDWAGMIPIAGMVFDAANAGLYIAEGNAAGAAMSGMAFIPIFGDAFKGAKKLRAVGKLDDAVDIFRGMGPEEFADITKTGKFRTLSGATEGKYFAMNAEDATTWGRRYHGDGAVVVSARIPRSVYNSMDQHWDRLDGIGPAFFARPDSLDFLNRSIMGSIQRVF